MKKCKECMSCECIKNAYLNSIKIIYSYLGAKMPQKDKKLLKQVESEILMVAGLNIKDEEKHSYHYYDKDRNKHPNFP